MRTRDFLIVFVCLVSAGALLFAAGAQLDSINSHRERMKLVINPPTENMPPSLAVATVAMGAFRGLIVDILWMRADTLKEEGQFFDALQLAQWITTLQPRFGAVWEFHAWNMAYNISVAIPATQPQQRWQWVRNGYELLRDEGIPLNPKSIRLYHQLGWIFQHKLGGVSDDAHEYYKLRFAEEIGPLLESADNGLRPEDNAYYEALMKAPQEWAAIAGDPNVAAFIRALRTADEGLGDEATFVRNYLSLRQNPQRFKPAAFEVIDAYRGTEALKRFDLFAKAWQLRHEWKLDPGLMHRVSQMHGPIDFSDPNRHYPFDWRHPDSHAIYWAVKGLEVAKQEQDREYDSHETNTDRIVLHSLQNLFRYGKIVIREGPAGFPEAHEVAVSRQDSEAPLMRRDIYLGPDLRIFDSYNKAALAVLEKYKDDRGRYESLGNGHRNMLKNAVFSFYQGGLKGEAQKILNELRRRYPKYAEFNIPLEEFARNRFLEEIESIGIHDVSEQVVMLLTNAYRLYALRDDDAAAANEHLAREVLDYYNRTNEPNWRIDLPTLPELRYVAIGQFLNSEAFPLYIRQGLLDRIEIEQPGLLKQLEQAGEQLRQRIERLQQTQAER